jgi:IS30 family transposase
MGGQLSSASRTVQKHIRRNPINMVKYTPLQANQGVQTSAKSMCKNRNYRKLFRNPL